MSDDSAMPPPDAVEGDVINPAGAALVPIEQHQVNFYGDEITGVLIEREGRPAEWYVPLRPLTAFLGLTWPPQYTRTKNDPVLGPALLSVTIIITETPAQGRGRRDLLCLPLRYLPGWLFGINVGKVKPALADKITLYRRDCFDLLWQAFKPDILPNPPPAAEPLTGAALGVEIAAAVYHLAQQQYDLESGLNQVAGQQSVMADYMRDFIGTTRQRLTGLELQLSGGATITEAQAAEIVLAVKLLGQQLESRGDKAGYQKVYSEMYRRYGIATYRNLPAARYKEVATWLHDWYQESAPPTEGGQDRGKEQP